MKQQWRLLAALLLLPALPIFSQEEALTQEIAFEETAYTNVNKTNRDQKCNSKKLKPLPEEAKIRNTPEITPPVAPCIVDGSDTFLTAEFIYWRTYIDAMEYAYGGVADGGFAVPVGSSVSKGSARTPDFSFEPGVKVGLGFHPDHDGWDVYANWTFLSSDTEHNSKNNFAGSGSGMTTVQSVFYTNGSQGPVPVSSASSSWKQDFNVIDLELGRDFFISHRLTLRPQIGLKSAWVHETTTSKFGLDGAPNDGGGVVTGIQMKNTEHMWGIGIRAGVDSGWHFTKHWMIYGDLAVTNLWGTFHKTAKEWNTESLSGNIMTQNTTESYQTLIPVIEAGLGFSYITWFSDSHYRFELRAGWEEQIWIDYNRSQDFNRVGNLTVQGLTLKAMLNF